MIDVSGRFDAGLIGVLWQVESVGWLRVPYATGTIYGVATGLRGYVNSEFIRSLAKSRHARGEANRLATALKAVESEP